MTTINDAQIVPLRKSAAPTQREPDLEPVDADVVDEELEDDEAWDEELEDDLEDEEDASPSRARELALRVARPLPSPRRVVRNARWWSRIGLQVVPWLPVMAVRELVPVLRGTWRVAVRWSAWVHCTELAEAVKEAKENERSKATERLTKRRSARAWGSLLLLVAAAGLLWWLSVRFPLGFWGAVVLLAAVLDAVGRAGRKGADNPLPVATSIGALSEDVPLAQIERSIFATFEREGFEEGSYSIAAPLSWDEARKEYRIRVRTADEIKPEHVEAVGRAIGAADGAIRNLATGVASIRELVIRVGDPLAQTEQPPYIETGALSIKQPLDLGESAGDRPFAVKFAGLHTAIVGKTGSGKTDGLINTMIDRLSACRDAVIWGCDLQMGPAFPMWRGVIRRTAYTLEEAAELLAAAQAEIDRRMKVLQRLAEDDDPANDKASWDSDLGPALVIIIDEFAVFAANNGTKNRPDLMTPLEQIIRTGRKVWVLLVLATQKTGNSDFGSTVISSQTANKIMLACENDDTVTMLSKALRDAGWLPHLLSPAEDDDPRDAGKCYVYTPTHRTPDIYRTYAPMPPREIKRRARQRMADGLPTLDGARRPDVVDAVEVPPIVAAVAAAFAETDADRIPTTELIAFLATRGIEVTDQQLSDAMRIGDERIGTRWREVPSGPQIRGYKREAVDRKMRSLS